jgi:hypothetical protein
LIVYSVALLLEDKRTEENRIKRKGREEKRKE